MDWFKKHTDTVIVLGGILASILWMNHKFSEVDQKFFSIEKDIAQIKTVLIMQKIMPNELCTTEKVE
jgi:hypothetical protein